MRITVVGASGLIGTKLFDARHFGAALYMHSLVSPD
jgi:hypothetical protein